ncbi:MAG: hypothetical protein J7623_28010 [Chitinophaga sp.]|nr:hypothetical protein [Chitinophaga sp.]MBO9732520.1 hypothetical protein [Chitinophaga sp.]
MKKKTEKKMTLGTVKVAKLNVANTQMGQYPTTTVFTTTTHHTFDC